MAVPHGALALIPARGGSKGIPGKNLQTVGDVPLVCRSIRAAQASNGVGRVVVSTDDDAIAEEAKAHGAEVVRRPAAIAGDSLADYAKHLSSAAKIGRNTSMTSMEAPSDTATPCSLCCPSVHTSCADRSGCR